MYVIKKKVVAVYWIIEYGRERVYVTYKLVSFFRWNAFYWRNKRQRAFIELSCLGVGSRFKSVDFVDLKSFNILFYFTKVIIVTKLVYELWTGYRQLLGILVNDNCETTDAVDCYDCWKVYSARLTFNRFCHPSKSL